MDHISIYTDGSARNKKNVGGNGGFGFVVLVDGSEVGRGGGFAEKTTSNRMEMMAIIKGVEWVKDNLIMTDRSCITVTTDSQYVNTSANRYIHAWRRRNFGGIANPDLWKQINSLMRETCMNIRWKRGHDYENNYWNWVADGIANEYREELNKGEE